MSYKIDTILTDHGIQFIHRKQDRFAMAHSFTRICREPGTDQLLTQVNPP